MNNYIELFKQDLNYIQQNLSLDILKKKDKDGFTSLHYLFRFNKDLETFKYVLIFTKKECPRLFLEKYNYGIPIIHYLFYWNNNLEIIKYVLDFTQKNYPSLFLEKTISGCTFFEYYFSYNYHYEKTTKYISFFTKNNFPEILSDKRKFSFEENLILPLTFQIKN